MKREQIKKVHVVYKTHLDIGFTDLGETVLSRYLEEYIPHSIELAEKLNTEKEKLFIWTVGSYLIDYFFKHAKEAHCKRLEKAIERGDICWHGLACTTHTELMDEDLFRFGLSLSRKLDERFGKQTICAKMTDVPGHCAAMVSLLAENGIKYLHLGVNPSSMVPEVPDTFRWRFGKDEIIVQYSYQYGSPCYVEGMEEVLEFAHTGDNLGPQSKESIQAEIDRIKGLYPNAQVVASTMDSYAESVMAFRDSLPVVEEEIGDTWIHGVGTDPLKISRYKALLELKNKWIKEERLNEGDPCYHGFMTNLLLITEHTWGLDFKKYLADFTNWDKADFQKARREDVTTLDFLTNRNAAMLSVLEEDFKKYRNGAFTGSYAFYEQSHAEQMEYITKAVNALPIDLKKEAEAELKRLDQCSALCDETVNQKQPSEKQFLSPFENVEVNGYTVSFSGSGELVNLEKANKKWIQEGSFGRLVYSTYDAADVVNNYYRYNRDFRETGCWSEGDFSKPGLEFARTLSHKEYLFGAKEIVVCGNQVIITLSGCREAAELFGCPRKARITYQFEDSVKCRLSWCDKDANKMPEAIWFDQNFDVENPTRWTMTKLGSKSSPLNVVKGGNRRQHCVESLDYQGADGTIKVRTIHAPLVSVGGRWLFGDYRELPDLKDGFSYCLFNNKWGTNFKMWCEDSCTFEFEISLD